MAVSLISTRKGSVATPFEAVLRGLAPDGGLYFVSSVPRYTVEEIREMTGMPYANVAAKVIGTYFDGIPKDVMQAMCESAYASFAAADVAPLIPVDVDTFVLELFHGPTLAFKDVALQMLPHLMAYAAHATGTAQKVLILVATSGDTGKAALSAFADKADTAICVFYPEKGVSEAQKLQMQTQKGQNVGVFSVSGNFDDCQRGVKALMGDAAFLDALTRNGFILSSANSINIGRLVPQIAYYFAAYAKLCQNGAIAFGDEINFTVPTGNFGNILAGWMAKQMGLPIGKLVGASNRNNVLDTLYRTGVYKAGLTLHATSSPSMDILVSSNLERLLFALCGNDGERVDGWMKDQMQGRDFEVGADVHAGLHRDFLWGWADDRAVDETLRLVFDQTGMLIDPHTAVGMRVTRELQESGRLPGKTVVLCTASPYKFASDVIEALGGKPSDLQSDVADLSSIGGTEPPEGITVLFDAKVLHRTTLNPNEMKQAVCNRIGIK
jgi:threonine synthase